VPDAIRTQRLDYLRDLFTSDVAAFLADVDRDPEAGRSRVLHHRHELRVVITCAADARSGDVDPHNAAVAPVNRLLDDDRVLSKRERPVHHQDQACAHVRVLERRAVESAHRGENDVVEITFAAAVALHRVEPELERRDSL
jgi:hypothetical protein